MINLVSTKVVKITHIASITDKAPNMSPTKNLNTVITSIVTLGFIAVIIELANRPLINAEIINNNVLNFGFGIVSAVVAEQCQGKEANPVHTPGEHFEAMPDLPAPIQSTNKK